MAHGMREVELRPARPQDAPALSRLGTESFVAKFGDMYRPQDLSAYLAEAYSEVALLAEMARIDRLYRLAWRGADLVGFCKLGLTCGFPEHARGHQVLELKQLYTDPDATGLGIGGLLMDWAMAEFTARGADEVQISVWSGNLGAQRFYARYGFAKVADTTFRVGEQLDEEFLLAQIF